MFYTDNTPIEEYSISGKTVFVKREDLSACDGCAPSSKVRGAYQLISNSKEQIFGLYNTRISLISMVFAPICHYFGKRLVLGYPELKNYPVPIAVQQAEKYGAALYGVKNPRTGIGEAHLRNYMKEVDGYYIPLGSNVAESILVTKKEMDTIKDSLLEGTLIVSVGSGVTLAGILLSLSHRLFFNTKIIGVTVGKDISRIKSTINKYVDYRSFNLTLLEPEFSYTTPCEIEIPFNCNRYYDAKAYKYLVDHINELPHPILFWNIGGNLKEN